MSSPFFSVIMATYNRPDKIVRAIDSVLKQTFTDFELIIVNDGSSISYADVESYLERLNDSRIKYYCKAHEERSAARNFAIDKVSGKYICFLDDDDIYYENHLSVFYKEITVQNIPNGFYITRCVKRYADNTTCEDVFREKNYQGVDILIYDLFGINSVCVPACLAKKETFSCDLTYLEDFEYWLKLSSHVHFIKINQFTHEYIFHDTNTVLWNYTSITAKLKTICFLKKKHSDILPSHWLNDYITNLSLAAAEIDVKNRMYRKGLHHLLIALSCFPLFLQKRSFYGLVKLLILSILKIKKYPVK